MPEPQFTASELFFSRTDLAGRIISGNAVFSRVSGYRAEELAGQPHNVVRHPDMPRAVFALFWEILGTERPVAAYVCNRTRDGHPYWVIASAYPVRNGYLSIRVKPSSPMLSQVQQLYTEMRALEREHEADPERGKPSGIQASSALLHGWLARHGYCDYERFMHAALSTEVTARQQAVGQFAGGTAEQAADTQGLVALPVAARNTYRALRHVIGDLGQYAEVSAALATKSAFLRSLAEDVRVFSFNTLFASSRLGADGIAIAATASLMRDHAHAAGRGVDGLGEEIARILELIDDLRFRMANVQLRTEAAALLGREVSGGGCQETAALTPLVREDLRALVDSLDHGVEALLRAARELDRHVEHVARTEGLAEHLHALETLQMNGRIEAARVGADTSVTALFTTIGAQVHAAISRLEDFAVSQSLGVHDLDAEARAQLELGTLDSLATTL